MKIDARVASLPAGVAIGVAIAAFASHIPAGRMAAGAAPSGAEYQAAAAMAPVAVEAQPLAANIERVAQALDSLGAPLPADVRAALTRAGKDRDARVLQQTLDSRVLIVVHINPEARVRVMRPPQSGPAVLQQAAYTPALVKVVNDSRGTQTLRVGSPQAGPVYAGMSELSASRMQQPHLRVNENVDGRTDRFLDLEMFTAAPMTSSLSGLEV